MTALYKDIIDYLTQKRTLAQRPPLPVRTLQFWQTLFSAITAGDLDWHTITERPSDLPHTLDISHERIIALLEEQNLACTDVIPMELQAIMTLTNEYIPQLYTGVQTIVSEQALESIGGKWQGETRRAYQLDMTVLAEHFPHLVPEVVEAMA